MFALSKEGKKLFVSIALLKKFPQENDQKFCPQVYKGHSVG
jgi:hypothetical protein